MGSDNTKTRKKRGFLGILLVLVFAIAGAYLMFEQKKDDQNYDMHVTAVVTKVDYRYKDEKRKRMEYRADCTYEVDGIPYYYTTSWRDNEYRKGDEINININSNDPDARNRHMYSKAGWVCFCLAGVCLYFYLRK